MNTIHLRVYFFLVITCVCILLNQLNFVTIWIFYKRDDCYATFHWTCFTNDITTA